jgi:broad specificity phosphatase PhoE
MTPSRILLMRHAEKSGDPTDPDLSDAGQARAQRLADYIPATFGAPDLVFASAVSKHSARPYETVEPLAKKIGVPIDATFADQDYGALAIELLSTPRYTAKLVLICWHHGNIPSLARSLKANQGDCPDPWDPLVFNLILQLDYEGDQAPSVTRVSENF